MDDLEEAISLHREALALRPVPHPHRSTSLNNLANVLWIRFERKGPMDDLEQAILLLREALTLCPAPHPDRFLSLDGLARALSTRFMQKGHAGDLEEAILLHREALILCPTSHPRRSAPLSHLANALSTQFKQNGQVDDIEEAISLRRDLLMHLPSSHPRRWLGLSGLASSLCEKVGFSDTSMDMFRAAVGHETGSVRDRLKAAQLWAMYADDANHPSALEAYQDAIQLLPQVAMLASDANSRHQLLADRHLGSRLLSTNAAACAIRLNELDLAVEMLEEGRSIFWSQALQLRTPLDDLRHAYPELAQKLREIFTTLERSSFREGSDVIRTDVEAVTTMEAEAARFRQLNEARLAILEEVRALKGFTDFLRPKKLNTLKKAAVHGPVVLLNASKSSCDALIVTLAGVEHVPLSPQLTGQQVSLLASSVLSSVSNFTSFTNSYKTSFESLLESTQAIRDAPQDRHLGRRQKVPLQTVNDVLRGVLAVLWKLVVHPVIRHLKLEVRSFPAHVLLCSGLTKHAEVRVAYALVVVPNRSILCPSASCSWHLSV